MGNLRFIERHFRRGRVTQEEVEKKFMSMRTYSRDKLDMVVLYFLTDVINGNAKRGTQATVVNRFIRRVVADLDDYMTYPWGRWSFFYNLKQIESIIRLFKGAAKDATFPSFVIPLEILPFEAIPELKKGFHEEVVEAQSGCPRMCKSEFVPSSMRGFHILEINEALEETTINIPYYSCYTLIMFIFEMNLYGSVVCLTDNSKCARRN